MHKYLRYKVFVLSNCKIKVFKSFYKSFRLKVFIEKTLKPYMCPKMNDFRADIFSQSMHRLRFRNGGLVATEC